jgi:uncharacterized membrane protein YdbT with pleckstrin-like domain
MVGDDPIQVFGPNAGLITFIKGVLLAPGAIVMIGLLTWLLHYRYTQQLAAIPDDIGWSAMVVIAAILVSIPYGMWLLWVYIKWNVIEYRLYDDQFEEERGVFNKKYRSAAWSEATDVQKEKTIGERLLSVIGLGIADIAMSTAGEDGTAFEMRYVNRPSRAYNAISSYIEQN